MQRLPESELDVMLALWEAEGPMPRAYFDQKLAHKGWSANALNSFLSRLEDRGYLRGERQGKSKYYTALVPREDYLAREGRNILQKLYNNSLKSFVLSISGAQGIEPGELDELQSYLDKLKEDCANER